MLDETWLSAHTLAKSRIGTFPGTFHGSMVVEHATVSKRDAAEAFAALARALGVELD